MADALTLSLDQGGSSSRAIVFNQHGDEIASAQVGVATQQPRPQWVEQNPTEVVDSLREVAEQVIIELTADQQQQLKSCGLVCQRSSMVCWDAMSGEPVSAILSWQDTRASDWLEAQQLDRQHLYELTGLIANSHFGASKMNWCLHHLDKVKVAATNNQLRMAPLAAFLANQLLVEQPFVVDPANASRTLLMNLETGDWDKYLLGQFGIQQQVLPAIVASNSLIGQFAVAGLSLPMQLLTGDQNAAGFANGEPDISTGYINIGTGAFIYRLIDQPAGAPGLLRSVLHWPEKAAIPQMIAEGTVNGAGSALQWLKNQQAIECWDELLTQALQTPAEENTPLFINGVGGLGSPDWKATLDSYFVGEGSPLQQMVAVIESIVFLIGRNFERLSQLRPLKRLTISGGLSQSDKLCQSIANFTGLKVARTEQCEATARGAAFLLAQRPQHWRELKAHSFTPVEDSLQQRRFQRWTALLAQSVSKI